MVSYIFKRLLSLIPVFIGITLISFSIIHLAPGKPTDLMTQLNPKVSFEAKEKLIKLYNLDKPVQIQYMIWLKKLVRFDFGNSFVDGRLVIKKIFERLPITILINILSMVLIFLIAVPIGVISAVKRGSLFDKMTTLFVFVGFATPGFWLALILMSIFSVQLGWFPVAGIKSLDYENFSLLGKVIDLGRHLVMPVLVSSFGGLAGISRYMRQSMLGVIYEDFIRTARAKGLPEKDVLYRHALKNAILPIITILGLSIPGLIGGSVIFETIFSIPGMGQLFYQSVMARDYPVVMAVLVIGAILTLLANLAADITYFYVDPRIRVGRRANA
ncbi:MAG: ABC transporter permease [Candidatus Omnitrophota bacterium]|nr:ABC transporter permease [Candidatus Omnitrophota bacterium]